MNKAILIMTITLFLSGCAGWSDSFHRGPNGEMMGVTEYDSTDFADTGLSVDWAWRCKGDYDGEENPDETWIKKYCQKTLIQSGQNSSIISQMSGYAVIPAAALIRPDKTNIDNQTTNNLENRNNSNMGVRRW